MDIEEQMGHMVGEFLDKGLWNDNDLINQLLSFIGEVSTPDALRAFLAARHAESERLRAESVAGGSKFVRFPSDEYDSLIHAGYRPLSTEHPSPGRAWLTPPRLDATT